MTQPTDKVREEFETNYGKQSELRGTYFKRDEVTGNYLGFFAQSDWELWQAATKLACTAALNEAIEICRKSTFVYAVGTVALAKNEASNNCMEQITELRDGNKPNQQVTPTPEQAVKMDTSFDSAFPLIARIDAKNKIIAEQAAEIERLKGLLRQGETAPDSDLCNEDLATDIECIDVRHRGDPSYEHDAYYVRAAAAELVRTGYPIYTHPPAASAEDDGSDWFYKLNFIRRVLGQDHAPKQDWQTAYGMATSLQRERWAAEKAPKLVTADDVTHDMVTFYRHHINSNSHDEHLIAAAVNAFNGLGASK